MKFRFLAAAMLMLASLVFALDGQVQTHDPSTVIQCDGKFYCYGTGAGIPILQSDNGWTWRRAGTVMSNLPNGRVGQEVVSKAGGGNGTGVVAPDVIKVGDRYFLYYAMGGGGQHAVVGLLTNKTLDPNSPDYKWEDGGPVAWSLGEDKEDLNAIDPSVFHDPNDGRLWLTYGSYFGTIRLVELDPKTGKRLHEEQSTLNLANISEASCMIYHDGWYYLLTNHGTCCSGASSTYNIRVGRSKKVTGPFLDDHDQDMLRSGGKLFLAAGDRKVGPGHFGLLDLGDGVQKFSCHYEADLDKAGISVLDIRPLLWRDGWPEAGENLKGGTFQIKSKHTGTALELAVPGVTLGGGGNRGGLGGGDAGGGGAGGGRGVIGDQTPAQVEQNWPAGNVDVRLASYMLEAQQKWAIAPVANAGGYPGSPYFKITIAGTERALASTEENDLIVVPAFTGAPEQLWRLDALADGACRIMPKAERAAKQGLALTSIGQSAVTLAPFKAGNDKQQWLLEQP